MKKIITCIILFGVCVAFYVVADDIDDFATSLNQAWSQTNDAECLEIINDRLASNSNDVSALSAKMYYYVFAEGNLTNARSEADSFITVANTSTDTNLTAFAQSMYDEVYNIPLSESGPYSDEQKAQLREPAVSFPFIQKITTIGHWE